MKQNDLSLNPVDISSSDIVLLETDIAQWVKFWRSSKKKSSEIHNRCGSRTQIPWKISKFSMVYVEVKRICFMYQFWNENWKWKHSASKWAKYYFSNIYQRSLYRFQREKMLKTLKKSRLRFNKNGKTYVKKHNIYTTSKIKIIQSENIIRKWIYSI